MLRSTRESLIWCSYGGNSQPISNSQLKLTTYNGITGHAHQLPFHKLYADKIKGVEKQVLGTLLHSVPFHAYTLNF